MTDPLVREGRPVYLMKSDGMSRCAGTGSGAEVAEWKREIMRVEGERKMQAAEACRKMD